MDIRRGWRTRGHLPHADFAGLTQAITFRLADALPAPVLDRLRTHLRNEHPGAAPDIDAVLVRDRVHRYLDAGHGSCLLRESSCAEAVACQLRRHDGSWYDLIAYVIMPNHVHVLARMRSVSIGQVVRAWKGASARTINRMRAGGGPLWQHEYFDRYVRDEAGLIAAVRYIVQNPTRAGLGDWKWLWVGEEWKHLMAPAAD